MNSIRLREDVPVELAGIIGGSVIESMCEAKRFCVENHLLSVNLECNGFEMLITPNTDVADEVSQYFGSRLHTQAGLLHKSLKDIIDQCDRITTGNVPHKAATIKGLASNMLELINKNVG